MVVHTTLCISGWRRVWAFIFALRCAPNKSREQEMVVKMRNSNHRSNGKFRGLQYRKQGLHFSQGMKSLSFGKYDRGRNRAVGVFGPINFEAVHFLRTRLALTLAAESSLEPEPPSHRLNVHHPQAPRCWSGQFAISQHAPQVFYSVTVEERLLLTVFVACSLGQLIIDELAWRTGISMSSDRDGFSGQSTVTLGKTRLELTLYKSSTSEYSNFRIKLTSK